MTCQLVVGRCAKRLRHRQLQTAVNAKRFSVNNREYEAAGQRNISTEVVYYSRTWAFIMVYYMVSNLLFTAANGIQ